MAHSAAGKSDRKGITVIELGEMFPGRTGRAELVRAADLAGAGAIARIVGASARTRLATPNRLTAARIAGVISQLKPAPS